LRSYRDGRIVMDNQASGTPGDIWVIDARGVPNKLTADNPNLDGFPVWSPDGNRIVFASSREQGLVSTLYQKSSNGIGAAELLLPADPTVFNFPQDWSTSGIVFERFKLSEIQIIDIWTLSIPDKKRSLYLHNG